MSFCFIFCLSVCYLRIGSCLFWFAKQHFMLSVLYNIKKHFYCSYLLVVFLNFCSLFYHHFSQDVDENIMRNLGYGNRNSKAFEMRPLSLSGVIIGCFSVLCNENARAHFNKFSVTLWHYLVSLYTFQNQIHQLTPSPIPTADTTGRRMLRSFHTRFTSSVTCTLKHWMYAICHPRLPCET